MTMKMSTLFLLSLFLFLQAFSTMHARKLSSETDISEKKLAEFPADAAAENSGGRRPAGLGVSFGGGGGFDGGIDVGIGRGLGIGARFGGGAGGGIDGNLGFGSGQGAGGGGGNDGGATITSFGGGRP
ncbi:hypothetical protein C2S53_017108 [Perilla frutescens var. hirtella]|uniref:Uncharacterized protein n=1 Tax=Perilla frutescens var. hirtella TaxID=608512 RepID=A0AAD4IWD9_PERFH|nr:hypothetical protein C2S53_017108 [Perilla frutescens var. hirtella]